MITNIDLEEAGWTHVLADFVKGLIYVIPKHNAGDHAGKYYLRGLPLIYTRAFFNRGSILLELLMPLFDDPGKHWLLMTINLERRRYVMYDFLAQDDQSQEEKAVAGPWDKRHAIIPGWMGKCQGLRGDIFASVDGLMTHTYTSFLVAIVRANSTSTSPRSKSWTDYVTYRHPCSCTERKKLLLQAHEFNYFYTKPLGFIGGVALLWDSSKVYVTRITKESMHVLFIVKV
ncbi:hypothetical protein Cgig2_032909 [Carnegiea gigantea]|uniref:Ubiquitin-like protease family profile domain-containing protein n=1 Tax=Carnegiea gigantea TaxID=171969 RepID=A0A9Q1GM55_9CARY|nr:hypothetical protein Cgig2_032909 [Carnegiea gigantea]